MHDSVSLNTTVKVHVRGDRSAIPSEQNAGDIYKGAITTN